MQRMYLLAVLSLCAPTFAQSPEARFTDWPQRTTVRGTVAVGGSECDRTLVRKLIDDDVTEVCFVELPSAAEASTSLRQQIAQSDWEQSVIEFRQFDQFAEWLRDVNRHFEAGSRRVSIIGVNSDAAAKQLRQIRKPLQKFVQDRNSVVLLGTHAAVGAERYSAAERPDYWALGCGLIPDSVCCQRLVEDQRPSLDSVLKLHAGHFGIDLPEDALLVLNGRKFRVLSEASVSFELPAQRNGDARRQLLVKQSSARQDPNQYLVDLTEWRRCAIERTLDPFPAANPDPPIVSAGRLFVVGGGRMPEGLMQQFVEAAGGPEQAKLVYVPCTESETVSPRQGILSAWKRMGVRHASVLHTKNRVRANTDDEFYRPLKDATGIWFGGGRQWNFADSYYGTTTHRLMHDVLKRGGVIGGSSAGASVQGRYLARATPIQNFRIMAPGYERGGLGFLTGVAIDQHFTQRGRQPDLRQLVETYPQLLGIGIDEGTAIIVRGSEADVVGEGTVSFYDRRFSDRPPNEMVLSAGQRFDLVEGTIIERPEIDAETKVDLQ
ncbi:MAG: hypothetical protein Fues2KO_38720 [Fuerstiella sp.]